MNAKFTGTQVPTPEPKSKGGGRRPAIKGLGLNTGRKSTPTAGKGMGYSGSLMVSRSR